MRTQLCGDAHLLNFRLLASPERRLLFDINDFDETLPGPWEWDVKRLAASLVIAGRANGFDLATRRDIVVRTVQSYREFMWQFAGIGALDVWHTKADMDELQSVVASYLAKPGDRVAIAAYLGRRDTFDQALAQFSEACADQNESDHALLLEAIATGKVTAAATLLR